MTETRDRRRALLDAYRRGLNPPSERIEQIWQDVRRSDARYRIVTPRRASVTEEVHPAARTRRGRHGWFAAVAVAAGAAAVWWMVSATAALERFSAPTPDAAPYQHRPSADSSARSEPRRRPTRGRDETLETPSSSPQMQALPDPRATPGRAANEVPRRKHGHGVPSRHPEGSAVPPTHGSLAEETVIIARAEGLMRRGEAGAALEVLAIHEREFPRGELVIERRALRVIALCEQGNFAQGRGEASGLKKQPVSQPYRIRMDRACERRPSKGSPR